MTHSLGIRRIFKNQHGKWDTNCAFQASKSNNESFFHGHSISKILKPFDKASNREESCKNTHKIHKYCDPYFITEDDISKVHDLNTNIYTCDKEDTGFSYKDNITPESVNIMIDFTGYYGLAEYVHIQCIDYNSNDTADSKDTELGNQIDAVTENNHDCHN